MLWSKFCTACVQLWHLCEAVQHQISFFNCAICCCCWLVRNPPHHIYKKSYLHLGVQWTGIEQIGSRKAIGCEEIQRVLVMETTAASIVLCLEAGLDEWHGSVHRLGIPPSFLPEPSSLDGSDHSDDAVQFNSIIRTASGGGGRIRWICHNQQCSRRLK